MRRSAVELIERVAVEEREKWLDAWFSEEGQRRIRAAVARLGR
jgi:hypothetical protein